MSDKNREDGHLCYTIGNEEIRQWFEQQWRIWPVRHHQDKTTNLGFHYGGVLAYRKENQKDPSMSRDFASNVKWMDENTGKD